MEVFLAFECQMSMDFACTPSICFYRAGYRLQARSGVAILHKLVLYYSPKLAFCEAHKFWQARTLVLFGTPESRKRMMRLDDLNISGMVARR